jgi:hypothetical protein
MAVQQRATQINSQVQHDQLANHCNNHLEELEWESPTHILVTTDQSTMALTAMSVLQEQQVYGERSHSACPPGVNHTSLICADGPLEGPDSPTY